MSGKPDWQSSTQWRSSPLVAEGNITYPLGDNEIYFGPTASWASLQLRAEPYAGGGYWQAHWFGDAAKTIDLGKDRWPFNASTLASLITPCQASFVDLTFHSSSAAGVGGSAYAAFTALPTVSDIYPVTAQQVHDFGATVVAGGKNNYYPAALSRGAATVLFEPADTSAKLQCVISVFDELGNFLYRIADTGTPASLVTQRVDLPDALWGVTVVNNDALAAHSYDVAVVLPGI